MGSKDIRIRKSELVAKTQFLLMIFIYNYLQLLDRTVNGILLYPGFLRLILLTKYPERRRGSFFLTFNNICRGNPRLKTL